MVSRFFMVSLLFVVCSSSSRSHYIIIRPCCQPPFLIFLCVLLLRGLMEEDHSSTSQLPCACPLLLTSVAKALHHNAIVLSKITPLHKQRSHVIPRKLFSVDVE